jgi:hypothetical protein
MDNNQQLEQMIKIALQQKSEGVQVPEDLFSKINSGLMEPSRTWCSKLSGHRFNWRVALVAVMLIIVLGIMLLALSNEARVMAAEVVNSIKKIFVVEKVENSYHATEKSVEEFKISQGICKFVDVSDAELAEKVGYQIRFPASLDGGYQLYSRILGVKLGQKMDVASFQKLNERIWLAIDDDHELENLKIYESRRYTGAFYRSSGNTVGIYILGKSYNVSRWVVKKVLFENRQGLWLEHPKHQYYTQSDPAQKQKQAIQVTHSFYWEINGSGYYLRPEGDPDLSLDEALRIASSFSKE